MDVINKSSQSRARDRNEKIRYSNKWNRTKGMEKFGGNRAEKLKCDGYPTLNTHTHTHWKIWLSFKLGGVLESRTERGEAKINAASEIQYIKMKCNSRIIQQREREEGKHKTEAREPKEICYIDVGVSMFLYIHPLLVLERRSSLKRRGFWR